MKRAFFVACLLLLACTKGAAPVPSTVEGSISLQLTEERLNGEGKSVPMELFKPALEQALKAKGFTLSDDAPIRVKGTVSLQEEKVGDSKVGGPVPFFFVLGAYDLQLFDAKTGEQVGRVQGPLDVRDLKDKALQTAHQSYDGTVKAIAEDAAPKMADKVAGKLVEQGRVKAK